MPVPSGVSSVFDAATLDFLRSGCALIVATVDPAGEPRATRGWGLDPVDGLGLDGLGLDGLDGLGLDGLGARLRLVLDADDAANGDHVAAGRTIAVTATDVSNLYSRQLKGTIVAVEDPTDRDHEVAARYCELFFGDVHALDRTPIELLARLAPPDYVVCTFDVVEVFDQAPGPNAGAPVETGAG